MNVTNIVSLRYYELSILARQLVFGVHSRSLARSLACLLACWLVCRCKQDRGVTAGMTTEMVPWNTKNYVVGRSSVVDMAVGRSLCCHAAAAAPLTQPADRPTAVGSACLPDDCPFRKPTLVGWSSRGRVSATQPCMDALSIPS